MKKHLIILSLFGASCGMISAQSAIGAYSLSQPDLKGTARYMGMAGAFGALGGDLSAISQNPAGIGVYRSSDVGFTLDLDLQNSWSQSGNQKYDMSQTKFLLNNIGAVLTLRLPSQACPNLNFGFTYNKGASFNRIYGGDINQIHNSLSNYIAGVANAEEITEGDLTSDKFFDPYNPGAGYYAAPWLAIMGYDSFLISPDGVNKETNSPHWVGLWNQAANTNGSGRFLVNEKGAVDEFNIVLGGNISDVFYWGMNFDIVNLNYSIKSTWMENLNNAYVLTNNGFASSPASWDLTSSYAISGTGFNYQLGFIVKPVQQFRLGFAFHTPTWYNINEEFTGMINYAYNNNFKGTAIANNGTPGYNSYGMRTPWKIIASAAGVISNNFIVSFDYEWANYGKMQFNEGGYFGNGYYGDGYWGDGYWGDGYWDWYSASPATRANFPNLNDPYGYENGDIATYYKASNTFRIGLEYKPISSLSLRLGYSNQSSPVSMQAKNNMETIYTSGLVPSYRFDNSTNYITCGLGYRYSHVYFDLAYVWKRIDSTYHAYTPDPYDNALPSPQSKLSLTNNQIVFSAGYRF